MAKRISMYSQCPKCGSCHWKKTVDVGLTILSDKFGYKKRRVDHDGGMPWFFDCLECGYSESDDWCGA